MGCFWSRKQWLGWNRPAELGSVHLLTHTGSLWTFSCVTYQVKPVQCSAWFVCLLLHPCLKSPLGGGTSSVGTDPVLLQSLDHLPVWRWMRSGGDAAGAGCSPCRWSRTQPAGGGPPVWPAPNCSSSCCCRDSPRPPGGKKTPGWAVSCPRIWSRTLPLVTVGQRERELH